MDKSKEKILDEYIQFRRLRHPSPGVKDIENHIKKFMEFSNKPLKDYDEKILLDYLTKIRPMYKTNMLNSIKSSYLKNFIKWYFADYSSRFRHLDQLCKTEKAEDAYTPEDVISEEEFKKMIKEEPSHFWKAYFMTLFYGGCRPIEVSSLKWEKVEFEKEGGAYITIYSKKNKRQFIKYVPEDVAYYLKELQSNKSEWVFYLPREGQAVSVKGAYWKIKEMSNKSLGKKIDLYTLRHSVATIIYNKTKIKDDDLAKQMGHTKSMKGKYLHNNKEKIKEIAKSIYMEPEDLPPEKKHELEEEIKRQDEIIDILYKNQKLFSEALNRLAEKSGLKERVPVFIRKK